MAKIATDTGNTITEGYVIRMVGIEEYFETQAGALAWAKAGNIPSVEFYTDDSISDADKLDDLEHGNLMEHSVDI
tara:strand:- start:3474 stop:3698 length:225 start_codon:yes stop_codon:yes gene_type:complete